MPVSVAEYLGRRVDVGGEGILPVPIEDKTNLCPFNGLACRKIASKDRKVPVCSLNVNGRFYVVCEERLISTKLAAFTDYQKAKLLEVSQTIFSHSIRPEQVGVRAEVRINIRDPELVERGRSGNSQADFVLRVIDPPIVVPRHRGVILEVQGGGETSNTGTMQRHVKDWETNPNPNIRLSDPIEKSQSNSNECMEASTGAAIG